MLSSLLYKNLSPSSYKRFCPRPFQSSKCFCPSTLKFTRKGMNKGVTSEIKLSQYSRYEWNYTINANFWRQEEYSRNLDFGALWMINQCNRMYILLRKCTWRLIFNGMKKLWTVGGSCRSFNASSDLFAFKNPIVRCWHFKPSSFSWNSLYPGVDTFCIRCWHLIIRLQRV